MARFSTDVKAMFGSSFSASNSLPACTASRRPRSLKSTSCHPVNRFSTFHTLCPRRTKISFPVTVKSSSCSSRHSSQGSGKDAFEFGRRRLPMVNVHEQPNASASRTLQHFPEFLNVLGVRQPERGAESAVHGHQVADRGFLNHRVGGKSRCVEVPAHPGPARQNGHRKQAFAECRAFVIGIGQER